jgi:hypothetical protein
MAARGWPLHSTLIRRIANRTRPPRLMIKPFRRVQTVGLVSRSCTERRGELQRKPTPDSGRQRRRIPRCSYCKESVVACGLCGLTRGSGARRAGFGKLPLPLRNGLAGISRAIGSILSRRRKRGPVAAASPRVNVISVPASDHRRRRFRYLTEARRSDLKRAACEARRPTW